MVHVTGVASVFSNTCHHSGRRLLTLTHRADVLMFAKCFFCQASISCSSWPLPRDASTRGAAKCQGPSAQAWRWIWAACNTTPTTLTLRWIVQTQHFCLSAGVEVDLGSVRYHSSQPWPFPQSLMLGFTAAAAAAPPTPTGLDALGVRFTRLPTPEFVPVHIVATNSGPACMVAAAIKSVNVCMQQVKVWCASHLTQDRAQQSPGPMMVFGPLRAARGQGGRAAAGRHGGGGRDGAEAPAAAGRLQRRRAGGRALVQPRLAGCRPVRCAFGAILVVTMCTWTSLHAACGSCLPAAC